MNDRLKNKTEAQEEFTEFMNTLEFANLGDGEVAYIKSVNVEEASKMFPALKEVPEGIDLFSLHSADGTPIALTDSKAAAIADARENDLEPVSVH